MKSYCCGEILACSGEQQDPVVVLLDMPVDVECHSARAPTITATMNLLRESCLLLFKGEPLLFVPASVPDEWSMACLLVLQPQ